MFSPPKSINYDIFYNTYNNVQNKCKVEEIIEGTMINLFYINNKWEISTKTTIGGNNSFFKNFDSQIHNVTKQKTFREMFIESCKEVNLDLSLLNKDYNYSFVMQHNENRIVKPIYSIYLYLIKVYKINNSEKVIYEIDIKNDKLYNTLSSSTSIKFPTEYISGELTFDELYNTYGSNNTRFDCLGVMIYSPDGHRTKIRNPVYEEIKQLRGNQPKLQYHYLTLKKSKNIKKYLYYFQEHEDLFTIYKLQIYNYTIKLYEYYISCHIKKEKKLSEIPNNYKNGVYILHKKYIEQYYQLKKSISFNDVNDYFNNLTPTLQMFFLNYDMRDKV
jgi:hypothetical protein